MFNVQVLLVFIVFIVQVVVTLVEHDARSMKARTHKSTARDVMLEASLRHDKLPQVLSLPQTWPVFETQWTLVPPKLQTPTRYALGRGHLTPTFA